jgi:hypothetical protein
MPIEEVDVCEVDTGQKTAYFPLRFRCLSISSIQRFLSDHAPLIGRRLFKGVLLYSSSDPYWWTFCALELLALAKGDPATRPRISLANKRLFAV